MSTYMFKDACWPNVTFLTVDFTDNMIIIII